MGERGTWPEEASNKDTEIHFWLVAVAVGGFETCSAKATAKICLLGARHRCKLTLEATANVRWPWSGKNGGVDKAPGNSRFEKGSNMQWLDYK